VVVKCTQASLVRNRCYRFICEFIYYNKFAYLFLLPPPKRLCFHRCLFVCLSVCLFVCLLASLPKNFRTDLHEVWQWANEQMTWIRIETLVRRALVEVCVVPFFLIYLFKLSLCVKEIQMFCTPNRSCRPFCCASVSDERYISLCNDDNPYVTASTDADAAVRDHNLSINFADGALSVSLMQYHAVTPIASTARTS